MSRFYLTIDDSPTKCSREKLEFLNSRDIRAIWFCVGEYIPAASSFLTDCIKTGHFIGNHSYSHPHFSEISLEAAKKEVLKTDNLIDELYRASSQPRPAKLFRFPYGDQGNNVDGIASSKPAGIRNKKLVRQFLIDEGFQSGPFTNVQYFGKYAANRASDPFWGWSYDMQEYAIHLGGKLKLTIQEIRDNLHQYLQTFDGDKDQIVLIHDHEDTNQYFPELIKQMLDQGIKFRIPAIT